MLESVLEQLVESRLLIWGVFVRAFGLVYLIALTSLWEQVIPFGASAVLHRWSDCATASAAGSRGLGPSRMLLASFKRNFPTWRRFLYFPTLLWLNSSDFMLRLLVTVGCAFLCMSHAVIPSLSKISNRSLSAAGIVFGVGCQRWLVLTCYLCYLSLDIPIGLGYPCESLNFACPLVLLDHAELYFAF